LAVSSLAWQVINKKMVKTHVSAIPATLDVPYRTQTVVYIARSGLVDGV